MHRLQYRLRPSLRARHMPNADNGSDSSHLGHLFNSTTLNSAVLVTPCAPLLRFRLRKLMRHFARRQTSRLHPWSFEPFMTKFGDEPGCEPEQIRRRSPREIQITCTAMPSPLNACDATRIEVVRRNGFTLSCEVK